MQLSFEWDSQKNASNKKKHGISFEEAKTSFYDPSARLISDPDHSDEEERFVLLGFSERLRVLVVSHCYRKGASVIRIISARKANKSEQSLYKERLK
jgi:uncharacterized DUF497 family protein